MNNTHTAYLVVGVGSSGKDTWVVAQHVGAKAKQAAIAHCERLIENKERFLDPIGYEMNNPSYRVLPNTAWENPEFSTDDDFYNAAAEACKNHLEVAKILLSEKELKNLEDRNIDLGGVNQTTGHICDHRLTQDPFSQFNVDPDYTKWKSCNIEFSTAVDTLFSGVSAVSSSAKFKNTLLSKVRRGVVTLAHASEASTTWNCLSFTGADTSKYALMYATQAHFAATHEQIYFVYATEEAEPRLPIQWVYEQTNHLFKYDPMRAIRSNPGDSITYYIASVPIVQTGEIKFDWTPKKQADEVKNCSDLTFSKDRVFAPTRVSADIKQSLDNLLHESELVESYRALLRSAENN